MSDTIQKRGRFWHYDFSVGGQRHRGSTRQTDKSLAKAVVNQIKTRADRVAVYGPEHEITFAEAARLYLIKNGNDAHLVNQLVRHFKGKRVAQIKPHDITAAAEALYPSGKPSSKNRNVVAPASAIINHAAKRGLAHPIRCELYAVTIEPKQAGSKPWLAAFQAACHKDGLPHLAALARFMFETGARISQATDLTFDNLNLSEGVAILKTRKTGAKGAEYVYREAILTPAMVAEIANLPPSSGRKVFGYAARSSAHKRWDIVIKRHKLPKLTRHEAGRHGFFTETIVRQGMDVVTACDLGGMATPTLALKRYAHAEKKRDHILKAFGVK